MLFTVDSEAVPAWAGGKASFQRQAIIKHTVLIPEIETMIKEDVVDCITFGICWRACLSSESLSYKSTRKVLPLVQKKTNGG
nr:hypothetical protein Hi04_10k_c4335_00011 [uncultured bacterium]